MEFPNSNSSFGPPPAIDNSNPDFHNLSEMGGPDVMQAENFLTDTEVPPIDLANFDHRLTLMEDSSHIEEKHLLSGDLHGLEDVIPEQDSEMYQISEQGR